MVRVRDEEKARDKAQAILDVATELFAAQGAWATPTSAISKAAGIAEGTLFTYFKTKDALVNALYMSLKADFAKDLLSEFAAVEQGPATEMRATLRPLWDGYLRWALESPAKYKVMLQLRVSPALTRDSREEAGRAFAGVEARIRQAMQAGVLRPQPFAFLATMLSGLAEATLMYIAENPRERATAIDDGFETLWGGISAPAASRDGKRGTVAPALSKGGKGGAAH